MDGASWKDGKESIFANRRSIEQTEKKGLSRQRKIGWTVSWISSSARFGTLVTTDCGLAGTCVETLSWPNVDLAGFKRLLEPR